MSRYPRMRPRIFSKPVDGPYGAHGRFDRGQGACELGDDDGPPSSHFLGAGWAVGGLHLRARRLKSSCAYAVAPLPNEAVGMPRTPGEAASSFPASGSFLRCFGVKPAGFGGHIEGIEFAPPKAHMVGRLTGKCTSVSKLPSARKRRNRPPP